GDPLPLALVDLRTGAVQLVADSQLYDNTVASLAVRWSIDGGEVFVTAGDGQPAKRVVLGQPRAVDFTPPLAWSFTTVPAPRAGPAPTGRPGTTVAAISPLDPSGAAGPQPPALAEDRETTTIELTSTGFDGTQTRLYLPAGAVDVKPPPHLMSAVWSDDTKTSGWTVEGEPRPLDELMPQGTRVAVPAGSHASQAVYDGQT